MDEDELLYREMNPEDPWFMDNTPTEEDNKDHDGEENDTPRRNAFVLFWNPANSNYTIEDFSKDREQFGKRFRMSWSVTWPDEVQEGDKVLYGKIRQRECWHCVAWNFLW